MHKSPEEGEGRTAMNFTVTGANCTYRTQLDPKTQTYTAPVGEPIIYTINLRPYHMIDEGRYAEIIGKAIFYSPGPFTLQTDGISGMHCELMCKAEYFQGRFLVIQFPEHPLGLLVGVSAQDFNWICEIEKLMEKEETLGKTRMSQHMEEIIERK
jgi:hypothetical protein